jgi:hypothetical protein
MLSHFIWILEVGIHINILLLMHITFPAKGQLAYSMTAARFLLEIMNMI